MDLLNWTAWIYRIQLVWASNPAILLGVKHRPRPPEQPDLLRPRLVGMINRRHELIRLAALIDWSWFEREWAGFFPAGESRRASHPRLVAGLMYLQHAYGLSDEAVLARWVRTRISSTSPARPSSSIACPSTPPRSAAGTAASVRRAWSGC